MHWGITSIAALIVKTGDKKQYNNPQDFVTAPKQFNNNAINQNKRSYTSKCKNI